MTQRKDVKATTLDLVLTIKEEYIGDIKIKNWG